ncbi:hypothetical protein RMATCC62417_15622 [Rhizopus microsporus]|nr:hypothetical protein RMATCC62417_15622 [Rhizopus microsporus]
MLLGPSNVIINKKTYMPAVSNTMSVEAVLPVPIPSTGCTSDSITTSQKCQSKADKTEALKKATSNEQKQVRCPFCGGTNHFHFSSKLCPMNKPKRSFQSPKI